MRISDYLEGLILGLLISLALGLIAVYVFGIFGVFLGLAAAIYYAVKTVLKAIEDQNKRMEDMVKIMIDILLNSQQTKESE